MNTIIKRVAAIASLIVVVGASGCASLDGSSFGPGLGPATDRLPGDSLGLVESGTLAA